MKITGDTHRAKTKIGRNKNKSRKSKAGFDTQVQKLQNKATGTKR